MKVARADPHKPDLSVGGASPQFVTGLQFIRLYLVRSALDVDGHKLVLVLGLEVGTDIVLVNGIAPLREFFFAVASFGGAHVTLLIPLALSNDLKPVDATLSRVLCRRRACDCGCN